MEVRLSSLTLFCNSSGCGARPPYWPARLEAFSMKLSVLTHVERNARRLTEILAVLGKYGLADWLGRLDYEWLQGRLVSFQGERLGNLTREARIRLALTELGTTFIK